MNQRNDQDRSWGDGLDPDRAMEDLREALERARKRIEAYRREVTRDPGESEHE